MNIGLDVRTIALGAAVVFLAPMAIALAGGIFRSLTKSGIKGGLMMYQKGKELASETKETVEDLAAEAKAELEEDRKVKEAVAKKKTA
jgi:hypothetical protein